MPRHTQAYDHVNLSIRQRNDIERFKNRWPTVDRLQNAFQAKNACKVLAKEIEAITRWPQVTLIQIDNAYNTDDLALFFVTMMFSNIYALGNGGGTCNKDFLKIEAGNFLARFGSQCTMFDLMLYLATYRSAYKPDYVSGGDLSDITKRFPDYLKHKGNVLQAYGQKEPQDSGRTQQNGTKLVGKAALEYHLRKAAERGDNLLEGGLVTFGIVTREHAQELMDKYAPQAF